MGTAARLLLHEGLDIVKCEGGGSAEDSRGKRSVAQTRWTNLGMKICPESETAVRFVTVRDRISIHSLCSFAVNKDDIIFVWENKELTFCLLVRVPGIYLHNLLRNRL